jgi:hypothetical protein
MGWGSRDITIKIGLRHNQERTDFFSLVHFQFFFSKEILK